VLEIRRADLRDYLKGLGQSWREDASNLDVTRLRARLRHLVLPVLEREVQPAIVEHLGRLARMARQDESFWAALVSDRVAVLTRRDSGRLGIRCADLLAPLGAAFGDAGGEAQRALAQRLVRRLVEELHGGIRQLTARHVHQVLHLAEQCRSGHRTELPGAAVERSFDWLWFEVAAPDTSGETRPRAGESKRVRSPRKEFSRVIQLGAAGNDVTVVVPEIGRSFRLKEIDWSAAPRETNLQAGAIDRESLRTPLLLRNWRPGDSLRPRGRRKAYKLKELLRQRRVAVRERQGWPVLTSAGTLVWARGLPVAAEFSAGEHTRTGVLIIEEAL
jgi:tRNA(Ile)-lysidine synthase